jgi:two-component system NtrC family response regulator
VDLALVDFQLRGTQKGIELLKDPVCPMPPVVMISNKVGIHETAEAMKLGASDFLVKGQSGAERILSVIRNQLLLSEELREKFERYPLKGSGAAMTRLRDQTMRWAGSAAPVLILGESGTGKEAIARALHLSSPRKFKRFEIVNCPALPETLAESELVGYMEGAFSEAKRDYAGAFERANGGTLYLAEVGDLSPSIQTKLLTILSDREIRRLGASRHQTVDVRIVAATNRNPEEVLRPDFRARISEVILKVPPLSERREDIPEIVACWMERLCAEEKRVRSVSPEAVKLIQAADWPTNVRGIISFLRQLIVLGKEEAVIGADEVHTLLDSDALQDRDLFDFDLAYSQAQICFDRELLTRRLALFEGNRTQVAESLGISRVTLWDKMKRCGLS